MKINPDDPVLTAYVLGELDHSEESRVRAALASDDSLREEADSLSALTGLLNGTLGCERFSLGGDRIAEILRAGQRPDPEVLLLDHHRRSRRQAILAATGVAALVVIGFMLLSRLGVGPQPSIAGTEGDDKAQGGAPGLLSTVPGDSADLPGMVTPAGGQRVGVPLKIGEADPSMVERSLSESGMLPERDRFKVAQWINLGRVDPSNQPGFHKVGEVEVCFELGPCSWNPAATLLMLHFRPAGNQAVEVEAGLEFDPEAVKEVRLTGGGGKAEDTPVESGRINSPRTYLYELDLQGGAVEIGTLFMRTGSEDKSRISLAGPVQSKGGVSLAFATAGILGDFARWGASEGRDRETLVRLSRDAKELLLKVSDESTRYALDMILITEETLGSD